MRDLIQGIFYVIHILGNKSKPYIVVVIPEVIVSNARETVYNFNKMLDLFLRDLGRTKCAGKIESA